MPVHGVTFNVASHKANPVRDYNPQGLTPRELLLAACPPQSPQVGAIRGTSFSKAGKNSSLRLPKIDAPNSIGKSKKGSRLSQLFRWNKKNADPEITEPVPQPQPTLEQAPYCAANRHAPQFPSSNAASAHSAPDAVKKVIPKPNGFVDTVMTAYNYHHALVIRPDDVWLAILTQFNFFLNGSGRAELLRAAFVSHSGQKSLTVEGGFDDLEGLALEMSDLIEKNVLDTSLRSWAIPNFSTTTSTDKAVGAMVLMATLRAYFEYTYDATCCGIPRVTLLGTQNDWKDILGRAEKLKEYGIETTAWYHLLVPVLSRFVDAFDDPNGQRNIDFWKQVAHWEPQGSGPDYYSGWITAFCVFSDQGAWVGPPLNTQNPPTEDPGSLTAARFWKIYGQLVYGMSELILDDTRYHRIDCDRVPPSYSAVEVRLVSETEDTRCEAIAGVVGTMVFSSGDVELSASGEDDTVTPVVGWWVYEKKK